MRKNRTLLICTAALLLLTCALTILHISASSEPVAGEILVRVGSRQYAIPYDSLAAEEVHGTIINGKGEESVINAPGIEIIALLSTINVDPSSIESVSVISADEYHAEIADHELMESEKAYLILWDNSCRLVVFGDSNSKRAVRDVVRIDTVSKAS